jgi:hypothetical protein
MTMPTSTPPPDLPVSIADLVSRDLPVHWSEAVAIVGELCTVLTANSPSEAAVPDAADVFITSAGAVVLRQGAPRKHDTTELGYILHDLHASSTPTPVRLFVSMSISSNRHASVNAFAEALAYYERPGRTELIRAVHERALATPPAETQRQSEPVRKEQDQEKEEPKPVQPPRRRRSKAVVAAAAAAVLLCAVGAGVWFWMGPQRASSSTAFGALAAQARSAAEKLGATVRETLGIPSGSEQVAEAPATAPSPQKPRRVRRPVRAAASQPLESSTLAALALSTPFAAVEPTSRLPLVETMAPQLGSALMAEDASAPAIGETDVVEVPVYSSTAVDVLPPVLLYPHLPPTAPEVRSLPGNRMELLIGDDGMVERVKLIAGPVRMSDMMLLHSAKTWRFQPALKDGRSVRYRLVLDWTVTPR